MLGSHRLPARCLGLLGCERTGWAPSRRGHSLAPLKSFAFPLPKGRRANTCAPGRSAGGRAASLGRRGFRLGRVSRLVPAAPEGSCFSGLRRELSVREGPQPRVMSVDQLLYNKAGRAECGERERRRSLVCAAAAVLAAQQQLLAWLLSEL